MSINNLTSYNTLTIDGLDNVNIDGSPFDPNNYVSKINPISQTMNGNLDFGLNKVKSSSSPSDLDDLTNKNYVDIQDNNIINNISNNYLNKTTTSAQSIASIITFNKELVVSNNKKTNLSSKLIVDSNYKSNLTSASITTTQNLSAITNVGIIYQTSTTSTNPGILNLFPIIYNNRYTFSIELLGGFGSTNTYLQTSESQDGINPSNIIDVRIFPNGSTAYETLNYTFEASTSGNVIIEISTDAPSGITGLKWKNFNTYDMGVYISNITTNLTPSKIPIINDKQQLVSSGVDSIKIDYLDNVHSDLQMQLNSKANLSGGNSFSGTQTYSDQTASRVAIYDSSKALVSSSITTTTLGYLDATSSIQTQLNNKADSSALANYLPLTGGTLSGPLTISSGALTANTRLLGVPDATTGGNFWIGLTGSNNEDKRLAIAIIGDQVSGLCSGVAISKPLTVQTTETISLFGTYADTTAYNIYTTTANHYDGNPSTTYVMSGPSGYLTLAKKTTRNDTEACIMMGTNNDLSEIVSRSTDGSEWMPLNYACSQCYFVGVNQAYSNRASNPQTSQFQIRNHSNGQRLYLGTYYTGGSGSCSTIQSSDYYSGADHGTDLLINPLGGNIGVGTDSPEYVLDVNGAGRIRSSFYVGTVNNASSQIYFGGTTGDGDYNHTVIECRKYQETGEGSELLLFKGNDPTTGSLVADRIRLRGAELCFDTYDYFTTDRATENIRMKIAGNGVAFHTSGDNSYIRYGPNSTWSSYLHVGATTNKVGQAETAQVITTNGNLHLDSGYNRDIYLNYYTNQAGQVGQILSYGNLIHTGKIGIGGMSDGKLNIWNPSAGPVGGNVTHFGYTDNNNYIRGNETYMDTNLRCVREIYNSGIPHQSAIQSPGYGNVVFFNSSNNRYERAQLEYYKNSSYSNYYQGDWRGLNQTFQFYKERAESCVLTMGYATGWLGSGVAMINIDIRLYSQSTGIYYYSWAYRFRNYSSDHCNICININWGRLPAGWYDVYTYTSTNTQADGNDFLSLTHFVLPNGNQR